VTADAVLEVEGATKSFGAVAALSDVSLRLGRGEVLAVVGDNGAGKSTLIKCVSGAHRLDRGRVRVDGELVALRSPVHARQHGIETVYQDLSLFDNLSVVANLFAGRELTAPRQTRVLGWLRNRAMTSRVAEILAELEVNVPNLHAPVGLLSGGQRQAIAVARAVRSQAEILLLDEPLAAMGAKEGAQILDLVHRLKEEGRVSIIMILHNYIHVLTACDRVNLIQDGVITFDKMASDTSVDELTEIVVEEYRRARKAALAEGGGA
jgi:simple sugar transport system ATP-binding protein